MSLKIRPISEEYNHVTEFSSARQLFSACHSLQNQSINYNMEEKTPVIIFDITNAHRDGSGYTLLPLSDAADAVYIGSIIGGEKIHNRIKKLTFGGISNSLSNTFDRRYLNSKGNEITEMELVIGITKEPTRISVLEIEPTDISIVQENKNYKVGPALTPHEGNKHDWYTIFNALSDNQRKLLGLEKRINYKLGGIEVLGSDI